MKNTRKKVLVSSVAMLLVALMALSTATFAWFTQNTTATADGLYAKTVKASSLVISKANKAWATSITYSQGTSESAQTMFPASSGNGTAWFTAVSDNATTGVAKTISSVDTAASNAKYVYAEQLNVKNDGTEGTIGNIQIAIKYPAEVSDYIRVALVPTTDGAETCISTNGSFVDSVYGKNSTPYKGLVGTTLDGAVDITPKTTTTIDVPDLGAQQYAMYNLFVWFEGQDAACIDSNAGQTLNGLEFEVTGEPA